MKKTLIPAIVFVCTLSLCMSLKPLSATFKTYEKDSISIRRYGLYGCEISCKNEKGLIKKYTSTNVNASCKVRQSDFNGDGIDEIYISDEKNNEIIDFSKDIPLRISDEEDFSPLKLKFTQSEDSVTAFLDNGQSFELFPENPDSGLCIEETAEISVTDFNADKINEICLTQNIKNKKNEVLYTVKTYRIFNGRYFTISDIKVEEKRS